MADDNVHSQPPGRASATLPTSIICITRVSGDWSHRSRGRWPPGARRSHAGRQSWNSSRDGMLTAGSDSTRVKILPEKESLPFY